jgi:hypothetical protein
MLCPYEAFEVDFGITNPAYHLWGADFGLSYAQEAPGRSMLRPYKASWNFFCSEVMSW